MVTSTTFLTTDDPMTAGEIAPPVRTPVRPGTGHFRTFLDQNSGNFLFVGEFSNLSSALAPRDTNDADHPSAGHLHEAPVGSNGGIVQHLHSVQNADLGGKFGIDSVLGARGIASLVQGNTYALLHTVDNFGGEIRGQADNFGSIAGLIGDATSETIFGTRGDEVIFGLGGNDRLLGGLGDDVLSGGEGNDILVGGAGADTLVGGHGNDTYIVTDALDTVYEFDDEGSGVDTVRASITYTLPDISVENLILTGSAATNGTGTAADNAIVGNNAANILTGLAGDDVLNGRGGDDTLFGGDGNDVLIGGNGNDRLEGGEGRDVLRGGAGADVFVYSSIVDSTIAAGGRDAIVDFQHGVDRIDFSSLGASAFIGDAVFSGAAGEVRAFSNGANTFLQLDMDGDRVVDLAINLVGTPPLDSADFVF